MPFVIEILLRIFVTFVMLTLMTLIGYTIKELFDIKTGDDE